MLLMLDFCNNIAIFYLHVKKLCSHWVPHELRTDDTTCDLVTGVLTVLRQKMGVYKIETSREL